MNRKFSAAWMEKATNLESKSSVDVGRPVGAVDVEMTPQADESNARVEVTEADVLPVALSTLVQHWRRNMRWSVETAAREVGIDVEELIQLECEPRVPHEPRAIYFLANAMKVPPERLAQLAGIVHDLEPSVRREAVRFAAHSAPVAALTRQERDDLQTFLSVLRDRSG